jgi:hypothetical protein
MRNRVVAALSVSVLGIGCIAGMSVAPMPRAGADPVVPSAGFVRTVTLLTGDRVAVTQSPGGRPSVTLAARGGGATPSFQVLQSGTHLYVIPADAAGYIGRPLDIGLFDVNALPASGSATPMQITAAYAATGAHALPGTAATGPSTLTVRDPAALGRALSRQWSSDKRAGTRSGHLFDGIRDLRRAGPRPAQAAQTAHQPPGKLYTLTVKAFDRLGRRDVGDLGTVMNADNVENFLAGQAFYSGELAFSVPAGAYSVAAYISTGYANGSVDFTLATAPEVRVSRDTVVVLDARKGRRMSATVPQPTSQVSAQLNLQRNPATGVSFTTSFVSFGAAPLYATPTGGVHTGELYFYPALRLGDPSGTVDHVLYDLEFPYIGAIPADLSPQIQADQLATIDARYHSPVPGRSELEAREATMPWQAVQVQAVNEFAAPLARTEHVLPQPGMIWLQQVVTDPVDFFGFASDIVRSYTAGTHTTADWTAQPTAPGVEQETIAGQSCPACRSGDSLDLQLFGYQDASGHLMLPDPSGTENLSLYQDGTQVGQAAGGFASFPLSPDAASYRLVYDTARQESWWPSSTHTHTEWTFDSAERAPDPLPAGWTCGGKGGGGRGGTAAAATGCSFEPLLFARYATGAGVDDVVPAGGPATVDVTLFHQAGAATSPIASFTAQVSYDDGTTWAPVTATPLGDGRYRLSYDQPALDATTGYASLHITAADAAGSAVDQTITRAYPLAVSPPMPPAAPQPGAPAVRACAAPVAAPYVQCMAVINAAAGVSADQPHGLGPADIRSAYALSANHGHGRTVAIVDAYDDPSAETDLAAYRAQYGLPPCTTANGCFRKVNQVGKSAPLPSPDPGWGLEISLDLDAVSAACPDCRILLVEADSSSIVDLLPGVQAAAAMHADAISNSYGSLGEYSGEQTLEGYFRALRTPTLFATGDYGYGNGAILIGGISYPAASRYVIAVGGTSLVPDNSPRGWSETAWAGATSGCSAYIRKPSWQKDRLCGMRTVADVAAVADPATGLAVYDTFGFDGWLQVGGTSLATPVVASIYAMAGNPGDAAFAEGLYRNPSALYDVVGGSNGTNCSNTYLCNAVRGFDGPTGLGTPDGAAAYWNGRPR